MNLNRLGRYAETVRHLRPSQILGRLWFRSYRPKPDLRPAPPLRTMQGVLQGDGTKSPALNGPASATFLNEHGDIANPAAWQDDASHTLLWLYNLHYFDDLSAAGAHDRVQWQRDLIDRWISENPPVTGIGWQPYPTSLRIVNWIKWHAAVEPLSEKARASLAVQVRHLSSRLEYHILGNHLLANAKALFIAGAFFDGDQADRWHALGSRLLEREITEQILSDGAHFELSPMYHLIVLEDLLDIVNFGHSFGRRLPAGIERVIEKMLAWSGIMRHPDGEIPFFNDATLGIASSPSDLDAYGSRLLIIPASAPEPAAMLSASGYGRLEVNDAVFFADVAAVGPSYLPGHAHADTLSFELSVGGNRVLVNSGTSVYGLGSERQRQRGTAAHNTLNIDGANSSDVWAGFRVGRRAVPSRPVLHQDGSTSTLEASHNGYRHLTGAPVHARTWILRKGMLSVTDTVSGGGTHRLEVMYYLHPDIELEQAPGGYELHLPSGRKALFEVAPDCQSDIVQSSWHPGFGLSQQSHAIRIRRQAALPTTIHVSLIWPA